MISLSSVVNFTFLFGLLKVQSGSCDDTRKLTNLIARTLEVLDRETRENLEEWTLDFVPGDALLSMDIHKFNDLDTQVLQDKNDRQREVLGETLFEMRHSDFMHSIDWDLVSQSIPQHMKNLQPGSLDEAIFPKMDPFEFRLLSPSQLNRISDVYLFNKISIRHWQEFGPKKFAYLQSQVVRAIPKFVFKSLGRDFLEQLPDKQLEWLLDEESAEEEPSTANERKRMRMSVAASIEVARNISPDDLKLISEENLLILPAEALRQMRPETRSAIPDIFYSDRVAQMEQGYSTLLTFLSAKDLFKLPWAALATYMSASFYNGFTEDIIKQVPWSRMWGFFPGETIRELDANLLLSIPTVHYSKIPILKFMSIKKDIIIGMPVEYLNQLPAAAISSLTATQIEQIGSRTFNKIDKEKLKSVAWADIMRDFNVTFFNRLEPKVIQLIPAEAFVALTPQLFGSLDASRVGVLSVDQLNSIPLDVWKVTFAEALRVIGETKLARLDRQVKRVLSRAELARLDPKYAKALGRAKEVQKWIDFLYKQRLVEVKQVINSDSKTSVPLGKALESLTVSQVRELDWIKLSSRLTADDISNLSPQKIKALQWPFLFNGLSPQQLRRIAPRIIGYILPSHFSSLRPTHLSRLSGSQFQYVTADQASRIPEDTCGAISSGILINMPPASFASLSLPCMRAIPRESLSVLPKSSWDYLNPNTRAILRRAPKKRTIMILAVPRRNNGFENLRQII